MSSTERGRTGGRRSSPESNNTRLVETNRLEEEYGDECGAKEDGNIRIMSNNINGLGVNNGIKLDKLKAFIDDNDIDILGCQEVNVCWHQCKFRERLHQRLRGWRECCTASVAYNTTERNITKTMYGGVAMITVGALAHRKIGVGYDTTKRGRWQWTRYRGAHNRVVRVVNVYRPCLNFDLGSNYSQQSRSMQKQKDNREPRAAWWADLSGEIKEWSSQGDSLIIIGDWNEDARSNLFKTWKEGLHLKDSSLQSLSDEKNAPATHPRGKTPIDTILCSAGVQVCKAGYMDFGNGIGDHRALYIDVKLTSVLGTKIPPVKTPTARRLKMDDPRVVKRYNATLEKYLRKHRVKERTDLLQRYINSEGDTKVIGHEFEDLDIIRIKGMQLAERECRKLKMGGIAWTPKLSIARNQITVWMLVVRRLKGGKVSAKTIIRMKVKANMDRTNTDVSLQMAEDNLVVAFKEYKTFIKNASEKRIEFQYALAAAKAKQGNIKISQAIKNMVRIEEQRDSARRIRYMNGTIRHSSGLTRAVAPNENGEWVEMNTKYAMEEALRSENNRRFTQANDTPLMRGRIYDEFGTIPSQEITSAILDGTYIAPHDTAPEVNEVLTYLQLKDSASAVWKPKPLTVEECKIGWKNTTEKVSSAAKYGTHMGHWKAGFQNDHIAAIHTTMANVPYQTGYSPRRWQYGVNVMLEKEKGNARVDRLRTILLYEADFNFNNSMLGKNMMRSGEKLGTLAREQYGSRKQMTAIECALNKRLLFDIARHTKRPLGVCSCDLKSCYDRILHNFAAIAMQRAGAPRTAIVSMLKTIRKLKHAVRTVYGDSDQTFGGEDWRYLDPLHGIGQGNGAGPAIWAVVSSVLFDYVREKGYGAKICSPLSQLALHIAGMGFVDDTDIVQLGFASDDYWAVANKLQEALTLWENGAVTSGGLLVPKKSWYSLVDFVWKDGDWSYNSDCEDAQITVKNEDGVPQNLMQLPITEAKRMLGVYLAADGNNRTQTMKLRGVAEEWRDKVRTGALTRKDAWIALTSTVMKSLEYPLLATTLTKEDCKYIMAPILEGGLSRAGICRNMARALVHGPKKYKGLDLHDLYTTQGLLQIQAILNHCWRGSDTGILLSVSIEYTKLEIGLPGSLFNSDYNLYGHLAEESLIKHVWKFATDKGITMDDDVKGFDMLRDKDAPITSYLSNAYNHNLITAREWRRANLCRKYLRALTIADIATGDGKAVTHSALQGIRSNNVTREIQWGDQGKPSKKDWGIWRSVLRKSLCYKDGKLWIALGKWKQHTVHKVKLNWEWFWDKNKDILLQHKGSIWRRYHVTTSRRRTRCNKTYRYYSVLQHPPQWETLQPTTVSIRNNLIHMEGSEGNTIDYDDPPIYQPTTEGLQLWMKHQKGEAWVFQNVEMSDNIDNLIADIKNGTAIGASDGSFKDECGTAAWVLEDSKGEQRILGRLTTPGFPSDQSAYRSEISGIYGMVAMVEGIKFVWKIHKGHVTLGCDGKQAGLQSLDIENQRTICTQQSFDLLSGVQGYLRTSNIAYTYKHVKGHQDDNWKLENLDYWALLNVEMDMLAKDWWAEVKDRDQYNSYVVPKGIWKISLLGNRVSKDLQAYLREGIEGARTAEYWIDKRKQFTEESFFDVDWTSVAQAMKGSALHRQHWVTKFESGCCATGKMMHIWKKRLIPNCPRCNAAVEDTTHILRCQSISSLQVWESSIKHLQEWLLESNTCPDLSTLLITALQQWKTNRRMVRPHGMTFPRCNELWNAQMGIGWRNALGGSLSNLWKEIQHNYYIFIGSRKTGVRWVSMLIKKLWLISWDQWADRNNILHESPLADDLSGALTLDRSITMEWNKGTVNMPQRVKRTFPQSVDSILHAPLEKKKKWFTLVRSFREMIGEETEDEFGTAHKRMRRWVGLE